MKTIDFEKELKALDPRIAIVPNMNRPGLSNIKLGGRDVCAVPGDEILEESDNGYRYVFPNGVSAKHTSRVEALSRIQSILEMIKTPEGASTFFED